jgi:hypothetical protein
MGIEQRYMGNRKEVPKTTVRWVDFYILFEKYSFGRRKFENNFDWKFLFLHLFWGRVVKVFLKWKEIGIFRKLCSWTGGTNFFQRDFPKSWSKMGKRGVHIGN